MLQFKSVAESLVGREEQTQALTEALHKVVDCNNDDNNREKDDNLDNSLDRSRLHRFQQQGAQVVVLQGESGSGKTHLLERWWAQQQEHYNRVERTICIGKGKYDQKQTTSYGALVEAISDLLLQVRDKSTLRNHLSDLEESELKLLSDFVPEIKNLMKGFTSEDGETAMPFRLSSVADGFDFKFLAEYSDSSGVSSRDSILAIKNPTERFAYVFGSFLVMLSQVLPPNQVVFVDDLQWADENSLQLLKSLCANRQLSKILFVIANRPDNDLGGNFFPGLDSTLQSTGRELRQLTVAELDVASCNRIVSKVTELREEVTLELTEVCHAKTRGNPFFLLKFLESLQRRELLIYSMTKFQFTWDIQQLKSQTDLADNVAAIVLEGIRVLDADAQHCAALASRLGFEFHKEDVAFLVEGLSKTNITTATGIDEELIIELSGESLELVDQHLQITVAAGLLDDQGDGHYKFAHDQIYQSFLGMEGKDEGTTVCNEKLALGYLLHALFRLHPKLKDWALFGALQLLRDSYPDLNEESQMSLVEKNLLATQKASKKSAYHDAAAYSTAALALLNLASKDPWKAHGSLCKTVHLTAAKYSLASGDHDNCRSMIEAFLNHTTDLQEQANASYTLACSLRNQAKIPESIVVLQDVLAKMGEKIKTGVVVRYMSARETKKEFGTLTDEEILSLPQITDPYDHLKMKLLSSLFLNKYVQYEKEQLWFVLKRMLVLTSQLGLCKYSPLIMASHAYNLANQGNFLEGSRFGEIATKLMDKLNAKVNLPIVTFFLVVFVNHLRQPMFKSIPDLKRGFQVGMEYGDSQSAFLCATTEVCYQFMVGCHLKDNTESCAEYFRVAQEYGLDQLKKEILLMWQLTTNLIGASDDPTKFDGVAINEAGLMNDIMTSDDTVQLRYYSKYLMALGGMPSAKS